MQTDTQSIESSSSSEEEELVIHRPVFIKQSRGNKRGIDSQEDTHTKKQMLLDRIAKENDMIRSREEAQRYVDFDYSTDKEFLRRATLLNDDDTIDPDKQKEEWMIRQDMRQKRYRKALLEKQLEIEGYEANKMTAKLENDIERETEKVKKSSKAKEVVKKPNYRPQKLKSTSFTKTLPFETDSSETNNEYSFM